VKPLITALIDTYNHERYIEQALVSAVEQELSPSEMEIIVVDDGSTDKTASIIRKFVPRVKHLRKTNGGQASAFNAGFVESKGQIIAPLDGDDWWGPGKVSAVVEALEKNPEVGAVSHAYYEVHEKENEMVLRGPSEPESINLATREHARVAREHWHYLIMGALTVRRKVFASALPIPEVLGFSADGPIATAAMAAGVLVLSQALSYYRFHESNLNAVEEQDRTRTRRRLEMGAAMAEVVYPMLLRMGVDPQCVSELVDPLFIYTNRSLVQSFGGGRLQNFRTEMRIFRSQFKNPRLGYLLYKYLVVGTSTLLLNPRTFYQLRDWVGRQDLRGFREWAQRTKTKAKIGDHPADHR
jgi:glycosyltransferase involved in cell wall biosynthesis